MPRNPRKPRNGTPHSARPTTVRMTPAERTALEAMLRQMNRPTAHGTLPILKRQPESPPKLVEIKPMIPRREPLPTDSIPKQRFQSKISQKKRAIKQRYAGKRARKGERIQRQQELRSHVIGYLNERKGSFISIQELQSLARKQMPQLSLPDMQQSYLVPVLHLLITEGIVERKGKGGVSSRWYRLK